MTTLDFNNPSEMERLAKELRAELLAIAHDAYPRRVETAQGEQLVPRTWASTSTTTGLAGRIYSFIDRLDQRTGNRLAN